MMRRRLAYKGSQDRKEVKIYTFICLYFCILIHLVKKRKLTMLIMEYVIKAKIGY